MGTSPALSPGVAWHWLGFLPPAGQPGLLPWPALGSGRVSKVSQGSLGFRVDPANYESSPLSRAEGVDSTGHGGAARSHGKERSDSTEWSHLCKLSASPRATVMLAPVFVTQVSHVSSPQEAQTGDHHHRRPFSE